LYQKTKFLEEEAWFFSFYRLTMEKMFMKYNQLIFLLILPLISVVYAEPPANDDLTGAIEIVVPYNHTQSTTSSTVAESELSASCTASGASVWYQYTPSKDENFVVDTFDSDYDTVLAIWEGDEHPLFEIACNDDGMDGISQSQLNTTLTGETNYFISVNGFNNETGTLEFHANVLEPLSNDKLSKAINIGDTFPYSHRQQTNTASIEPKELLSKCATNSSNSVWYQYKPKKEKTLVLDTFGSNYDTVLSVWIGKKHPLKKELICNDDDSNDSDDGEVEEENIQSQLNMTFTAGETYYINISHLLLNEPTENDILVFNVTVASSATDLDDPDELDESAVVGMGIHPTGVFFDTNTYFISQIKTDSGLSGNHLTFAQTDNVTLSATIQVDPSHVGKEADILIVAVYKKGTSQVQFMRDDVDWKDWGFQMDLLTAVESKALPETLETIVYSGPFSVLGLNFPVQFTIYVGYRLENGDIIFNGIEPLDFEVQ